MNLLRPWLAGLSMGAASLVREPVLGIKRLVLPASYWRSVEFGYVWDRLGSAVSGRILDLGSPKDLACFLARSSDAEVVATDILESAVSLCARYSRAMGIFGSGPGHVLPEVQDGRSLTYPDQFFDAAYSVSVIEHIPGDGDGDAIRELVRVVRPGGIIVVTVPYDVSYRETFVDGDVYERRALDGEKVFFERHYDMDSLHERLLSVPLTRVVDLQLWGERLGVERFLGRIGPLRIPLSPFETALASLFLRRVTLPEQRPMAAFFTLEKLAS